MPPQWWYTQGESETESSEDETIGDIPERIPLDRIPLAHHNTPAPLTFRFHAMLLRNQENPVDTREMLLRDALARSMWIQWTHAGPINDDDTSTCDDVCEHDLTDASDNSEWEQDANLLEAFECFYGDENRNKQETRTEEKTIATQGDATEAKCKDQ